MRKANITLAFIAVLILVGFSTLAIKSGAGAKEIDFNTPKLQSSEAKLKSVNVRYEKLNTQLNNKTSTDQKTIDDLKKQQDKLEQQRQDLQKQVQAKADEKERIRLAAANAANTMTATQTASAQSIPVATPVPEQAPEPVPTPVAPSYNGSHEDWMAAAGISPSEYNAVDFIISHESGWRISAYNPSGAFGLCQALPASKMASAGADWETNPVTQLRWCTGYASGRYGGWWGAYTFWSANKWW